jgi:hypothetical protein
VVPAEGGSTIRFSAAGGKVVKTAAQIPSKDEGDFVVSVDLPGPDRLFERFSEKQFFERVRQEARKKPGSPPVTFPEEPPLTREPYAGRNWTRSVALVEPAYVNHGRLYFEQKNFERYGWDLGPLTPFVCAGVYFYDLALFPYHHWTRPLDRWDSSAGKCLPSDPTPLLWYREKFSLTGLAAQGAVVAGGILIVP